LNQFSAVKKRKFGNTLCSSQSTNHGLYLTQSSIKLGKKKCKEKNYDKVGLYKEEKRKKEKQEVRGWGVGRWEEKRILPRAFFSSPAIFLH